jgi:hypothetical protein
MGWTALLPRQGGYAKLATVKRNVEWSHSSMKPTTIGLDLAKRMFQVHGVGLDPTVMLVAKSAADQTVA